MPDLIKGPLTPETVAMRSKEAQSELAKYGARGEKFEEIDPAVVEEAADRLLINLQRELNMPRSRRRDKAEILDDIRRWEYTLEDAQTYQADPTWKRRPRIGLATPPKTEEGRERRGKSASERLRIGREEREKVEPRIHAGDWGEDEMTRTLKKRRVTEKRYDGGNPR